MLAILLSLFASFAWAQDCRNNQPPTNLSASATEITCTLAQPILQDFFKDADPCVSKDLLRTDIDLPLCMSGVGILNSDLKPIPADKVAQLASEIVRPSRFNKIYRNHLNRPSLAKLLTGLSQTLQKNEIKYISCKDLKTAAYFAYNTAKNSNKIGECYQIQTFGGFKYIFGSVAREIAVSPEEQKSIESLFTTKTPYHLSLLDADLVHQKRLTIDDLKELKALRKASELFEQATPLKNDAGGGFIANLKGELAGGDQLNCDLEARTHIEFLNTLASKGLIKNFEIVGTVERAPKISHFKKDLSQSGHVAVLLRSRTTGQEIIYDSWFEKGGEAAHILLPEDWNNLSLDFKNDFRDIVPLSTNDSRTSPHKSQDQQKPAKSSARRNN